MVMVSSARAGVTTITAAAASSASLWAIMVSSRIFPAPQDRRSKVYLPAAQGPNVAKRLRRGSAAVNESIDASRWNQYDFGWRPYVRTSPEKCAEIKMVA